MLDCKKTVPHSYEISYEDSEFELLGFGFSNLILVSFCWLIIIIYIINQRRSLCICLSKRSNEEACSFDIWYRDNREDFWENFESIFSEINPDFLNWFFKDFFSKFCISSFWTNAPIFNLFIYLLLERSFHLCNMVNFVAMRQFKFCLSFCLNICFGCKSCKN